MTQCFVEPITVGAEVAQERDVLRVVRGCLRIDNEAEVMAQGETRVSFGF